MSRARRRLARVADRPRVAPGRWSVLGTWSVLRDLAALRARSRGAAARRGPARTVGALVSGLAATAGGLVAGPVAAVAIGAYAGVTWLTWRNHRLRQRDSRERAAAGEAVAALAADLRAGLAPADLVDDLSILGRVPRVAAACLISEHLGAPLADLLERVDADLRAQHGLRTAVQAETAGTRATAWLLAALPFGGIALGASLGVDPVAFMLHSPLGAACVLGALTLQLVGLGWSAALVSGALKAVG